MNKNSSKINLTTIGIRIFFLIMWSLFIVDFAWGGHRHWTPHNTMVFKDVTYNFIMIRFKFFDYAIFPEDVNCYLLWCEFFYSTDGLIYTKFMRSDTNNQNGIYSSSYLYMKDKLKGANLQFIDCRNPTDGTTWVDVLLSQFLVVQNSENEAYASIKWVLTPPFKNVKFIKLVGRWRIIGFMMNQSINQIYEVK